MPVFVGTGSDDFEAKSDRIGLPVETTDPASPSTGDSYFNSTDGVIKVYDGTSWNPVGGGLPKFDIDDCFKSFEYQGNGTSQTFNVGFDCSQGCLILIDDRGNNQTWYADTERGVNQLGYWSRQDGNNIAESDSVTSFTSTGFTVGSNLNVNYNGRRYQVNVFKKHKGFFDMVKYTGNGTARLLAHNLGAPPAMVVYRIQVGTNTNQYHASTGMNGITRFNPHLVEASNDYHTAYPTDTDLYLGGTTENNNNTQEFIAYLFGGAPAGTQDYPVVYGSYIGNGGGTANTIPTGGTQAQFIVFKRVGASCSGGGAQTRPGIYIDKNVIDQSPNFGSAIGWTSNTTTVSVSGQFTYNSTDIDITGSDNTYNTLNEVYYYYCIGR